MDSIAPPAPPQTVAEFLKRLDAGFGAMPKRLQQCAAYTRRHLHLIAVSTISDMAGAIGVAPSAYVRFCQAMGFSGYSEMQALFRAHYTGLRPDYETRLATLATTGDASPGQLLSDFAEAGHKSLISIGNTVDSGDLEAVALGLATARVVHLVGLRRAFAVVSNMAYLMQNLGVACILHSCAGQVGMGAAIQAGDALFAVTFSPFSEETLTLAREVAKRDVPVFGLSDSAACPLANHATAMIVTRESDVGGFRALTAAMTVTSALAVAVGTAGRDG